MNVVVVGAGVIGCAVAYELASRGSRVQIVESRGTGSGATRASAGILAPYIEGHTPVLLQLAVCSLKQYDGFVSRVAADAQQPIEFRRAGTLQVALTPEEHGPLAHDAETLASAGVPHRLLTAGEIRQLEPALPPAAAGLLIDTHGYVGVGSLMSALNGAGARRGVTMTAARVGSVESSGNGLIVETSSGSLRADAVVIAAGSWSGEVTSGAVRAPVKPIRGQLLHLRLPAPPLARVVWGSECYLVPWQDGSVLVGATVEDVGFDESVTVAGVRELMERGERLMPVLREASFVEARAGLRPASSDELPIVGPSSRVPGLFYATGHFRNGVLLAPLTAVMIADLILHGRTHPDLGLVHPNRFGL